MAFYSKHIPEDQEIRAILHTHWVTVFDSFLLWISFGAVIPSFLYYNSVRLQELIPFAAVEIFLFGIFLKILYELYNWYNDIWVITDTAIYDIEWSLLKTKVESVHFESIEGIEVEKHRIWDTIFNKGDIVLHRFGEDELAIFNVAYPYTAVHEIEEILAWKPEEHEEVDRFDLIMDTLSGVVKEYLERNGVAETHSEHPHGDHHQHPHDDIWTLHEEKAPQNDDYTLDLRHETHR